MNGGSESLTAPPPLQVNRLAVATDDADHVYPLHNAEFEVWALRMEGRAAGALAAARRLERLAQPCAERPGCAIPGCHSHAPETYERFSAAFALTVALVGDRGELAELRGRRPPASLTVRATPGLLRPQYFPHILETFCAFWTGSLWKLVL
jgi:hypothetical protein